MVGHHWVTFVQRCDLVLHGVEVPLAVNPSEGTYRQSCHQPDETKTNPLLGQSHPERHNESRYQSENESAYPTNSLYRTTALIHVLQVPEDYLFYLFASVWFHCTFSANANLTDDEERAKNTRLGMFS